MTQRAPTPEEQQVLMLVNQGKGNIVLIPVILNEEPRFALAFYEDGKEGPYLRLFSVLLAPGDVVLDVNGNQASEQPPGISQDLN